MFIYTYYYHVTAAEVTVATLRSKPTPQAYNISSGLLFRVRERETVRHVVLVSLTPNEGSKPEQLGFRL